MEPLTGRSSVSLGRSVGFLPLCPGLVWAIFRTGV